VAEVKVYQQKSGVLYYKLPPTTPRYIYWTIPMHNLSIWPWNKIKCN